LELGSKMSGVVPNIGEWDSFLDGLVSVTGQQGEARQVAVLNGADPEGLKITLNSPVELEVTSTQVVHPFGGLLPDIEVGAKATAWAMPTETPVLVHALQTLPGPLL